METNGGFVPKTPPFLNNKDGGRAGKGELTLTPSPTSVEGFPSAVNSANRPTIVSRLISHQIDDVFNSDEEETVDHVLPSSNMVAIPDLDDLNLTTAEDIDADDESSTLAHTSFSDCTPPGTPEISTPKQTPEQVVQRKLLLQSVSSMVCGTETSSVLDLNLGPEREVHFHGSALGIKISRCSDGMVRILSVTTTNDANRIGDIYQGDLVREVSGVCLRNPMGSAEWNMTIGLIRMAPRPLKMVLAQECEGDDNGRQNIDDGRTRTVIFNERALGVKLHHNGEGRVEILSVAALPIDRLGDVREGDLVLEAGGCDLRSSLSKSDWLALVKYIREAPRPLQMTVTNKTNRW